MFCWSCIVHGVLPICLCRCSASGDIHVTGGIQSFPSRMPNRGHAADVARLKNAGGKFKLWQFFPRWTRSDAANRETRCVPEEECSLGNAGLAVRLNEFRETRSPRHFYPSILSPFVHFFIRCNMGAMKSKVAPKQVGEQELWKRPSSSANKCEDVTVALKCNSLPTRWTRRCLHAMQTAIKMRPTCGQMHSRTSERARARMCTPDTLY